MAIQEMNPINTVYVELNPINIVHAELNPINTVHDELNLMNAVHAERRECTCMESIRPPRLYIIIQINTYNTNKWLFYSQ